VHKSENPSRTSGEVRVESAKRGWNSGHWQRRSTNPVYQPQRGLGYNYEATKIFMPAGSKQPVVVHYLEHVPADVGAAFIWLKNRDPDHWRDVQNVEHVLGKYLISDKPMALEEWASARATRLLTK
jgi:hypothetical protein